MAKLVTKRFYFLVILLSVSVSATSQQTENKLNKIIEIRADKIRVDSLIKKLSKQSGINFSYNSKNIFPSKIITIIKHKQSLSYWLHDLNKTSNINYSIVSDHVILKGASASKQKINKQKPASKINAFKPKISSIKKANTITDKKIIIISTDTRAASRINKQTTTKDTSSKIFPDSLKTLIIKQNQKEDSNNAPVSSQLPLLKQQQINTNTISSASKSTKTKREKRIRESNYQTQKNLMLSIGACISKPSFFSKVISSNATGLGMDIKAEKLFYRFISGTAEIGYNRFKGAYTYMYYDGDTAKSAKAENFSNFPLLAGIKLNVYHSFYVSLKAGTAIKGRVNTNSAFTFSPAIGCVFLHHLDVGIKVSIISSGIGIPYPSPESARSREGRYGFWSFRLAYVL